MIVGEVTPDREAVIKLRIRNGEGVEIETRCVIDTGFTDYLTLPPDIIDALSLPFENTIRVDIPPESLSKYSGEWTDEDISDFSQASCEYINRAIDEE